MLNSSPAFPSYSLLMTNESVCEREEWRIDRKRTHMANQEMHSDNMRATECS